MRCLSWKLRGGERRRRGRSSRGCGDSGWVRKRREYFGLPMTTLAPYGQHNPSSSHFLYMQKLYPVRGRSLPCASLHNGLSLLGCKMLEVNYRWQRHTQSVCFNFVNFRGPYVQFRELDLSPLERSILHILYLPGPGHASMICTFLVGASGAVVSRHRRQCWGPTVGRSGNINQRG